MKCRTLFGASSDGIVRSSSITIDMLRILEVSSFRPCRVGVVTLLGGFFYSQSLFVALYSHSTLDKMSPLTNRDIEHITIFVVLIVVSHTSYLYNRQPIQTSKLTGDAYTKEVIAGHPCCFQTVTHMPRYTFGRLIRFLEEQTNLWCSSNISSIVTV